MSNIGKVYFSPTLVDREDPETGEIIEEFWRKEIPTESWKSLSNTRARNPAIEAKRLGKNLRIILQMRVVFPGNGNAPKLIFKE